MPYIVGTTAVFKYITLYGLADLLQVYFLNLKHLMEARHAYDLNI